MTDRASPSVSAVSTAIARRAVLGGMAATVATLAAPLPLRGQAPSIVVSMFGGVVERTFRTTLIEPFEKATGIKVTPKLGAPGEWLTSAMVNRARPEIDVLWLIFPESIRASQETDVLLELSEARIPNLAKVDPIWRQMYKGTGVGHEYAPFVIGYRTDMIDDPPKSWADFWNPKYAGKIAIPDIVSPGAWELLMVAAKQNGGSETNAGPGIEAMGKLKPSVKRFYKNLTEAANLLETGEAAVVGPITDFRVYALQDQGKPVRVVHASEGTLPSFVSFHIAKNTANRDAAEKFVDFAMSQRGLTDFCNALICGPTRPDVTLSGKAAERAVPSSGLIIFDWPTVVPLMGRYTEMWNRTIGR
ncbi:MAG: ABC transporter substrate-binding protein [Alphaproteobacteria bacterium]|nr:ABC transporter substrate-binding protein [Alphaproteobacteria bacterium]